MSTPTYELNYEGAKEMLLVEEVDNKNFLIGLFGQCMMNCQLQNRKRRNK